MWIVLCLVIYPEVENLLSQRGHWNSFSPVWIRLCTLSSLGLLHLLLQKSHWNNFSSVWFECLVSLCLLNFIFPRNWVWTFFACERFISCVNYFMSLHITGSRESFITKWTFKWSISALTSLVYTINLEEEGNSLGHKSHLNNIFPVSVL